MAFAPPTFYCYFTSVARLTNCEYIIYVLRSCSIHFFSKRTAKTKERKQNLKYKGRQCQEDKGPDIVLLLKHSL